MCTVGFLPRQTVSPERHIVKVNGQDVTLTYKEFEILCLLLENEGVVLTRRFRLTELQRGLHQFTRFVLFMDLVLIEA